MGFLRLDYRIYGDIIVIQNKIFTFAAKFESYLLKQFHIC